MSVTDAVNLALAGLDVTQARINTISRNITNAQTDGYTKKTDSQQTGALGQVQLGPVQRSVDELLSKSLRESTGTENQLNATVTLLSQIETAFGTPAANTSLSSNLTDLQNAFQDLSVNPEKTSLLNNVISTAGTVCRTLNSLSSTVNGVATDANAQLAQSVTTINQTLQQIDSLNKQIATHTAAEDITDLEDQRDSAVARLAGLMDINSYSHPDGSIAVYTKDGKPLIDYSVANVSIGTSGLQWNLAGQTSAPIKVSSGTVGGVLNVLQNTVPAVQGQLDDIARALTVEFNNINIPLFNDGGSTPLNGTNPALPISAGNPVDPVQLKGYAGRISVNQTVIGNPNIIHDGGLVPLQPGDTTVIDQAIALFDRTNVAFTASTGLPASGSFLQVTTDFIANQSTARANAQTALDQQKTLVNALQDKVSAATGVNIDDQVAQLQVLQNTYAASARVLQTAKDMFTTLFNAV